MNIKELQQKQDKELENNLIEYDGIWHRRNKDNTCELFTIADLRSIISKVRRETAEMVCDEMIGKEWGNGYDYDKDEIQLKVYNDGFRAGWDKKIKEEQEIKKEILKD